MSKLELGTHKMLAEVRGAVGWLTFNQPERRNAVSLEMWQAMGVALAHFESAPDVRLVVMRGAGGKAFASGADITEFDQQRGNAAQRQQYGEVAARGSQGLARLSKPLIALIDGFCIGGGLAIALNADIRFATPGSRLGIPAARLGLGYEYPGLAALARLVGPSTARDMLFSARLLDADEALRVGLVNFVVAADEIDAAVDSYVERIAANAPLTIKAAKAAVNAYERYSMTEASAAVATMVDACFDSDDYKEGRRAFAEKRPPVFTGH